MTAQVAATLHLKRNGPALGVHVTSSRRAALLSSPAFTLPTPPGEDLIVAPEAGQCDDDRLSLVVEYCFTTFTCDLLLGDDEADAPDIILDSSLKGFYPRLEELGLDAWNHNDRNCLLTLVLRVRDLYAAHCREAVLNLEVDRVNFDFDCISHIPEVQCMVADRHSGNPSIVVRIPLRLETNVAGAAKVQKNYPVARVRYTLRKHASGFLELVGVAGEVQFPEEWRRQERAFPLPSAKVASTLVDYLAELEQAIQDGLQKQARVVESRVDFVGALLAAYRPAVIDYDAAWFRHLTMYVEFEGLTRLRETSSCFLIIVNLPENYPGESPVVRLFSPVVYVSSSPTEYRPEERTFRLPNWPWPADDIAARFKHCIIREAKEDTKRKPLIDRLSR